MNHQDTPPAAPPRTQNLTYHVTDEQVERLEINFIREITTADHTAGKMNSSATELSVLAKLPGGMHAACTFAMVNSKRAMTSFLLLAPRDENAQRLALTSAHIKSIPVRDISIELTTLLEDLAKQKGSSERDVLEVFGIVGTAPKRTTGGRHKAPTRQNSNWPRLLQIARRYNMLAERFTRGLHQKMAEGMTCVPTPDGLRKWVKEPALVPSVGGSRKLVKRAREAGFLKKTGKGQKGTELTGLAKFLIAKGLAESWHYDQIKWNDAVREFYTTDPPEFYEDQWDEHVTHLPMIEAENEASLELEAKILSGYFDTDPAYLESLERSRQAHEEEDPHGDRG